MEVMRYILLLIEVQLTFRYDLFMEIKREFI